MRILTWNMAYMTPSTYKSVANRKRQWALLAALQPDIALLQECRPTDLEYLGPTWMQEEYSVVGAIPEYWIACSAILVRRPHSAVPMDRGSLPEAESRWLAFLSGYVCAADVLADGRKLAVASVHARAAEVEHAMVTEADHERVRRRSLARAWHNDLAAAALSPWVAGTPFVVGGDWNNALLFDDNYDDGSGCSHEFFQRRAQDGWRDALRKFHATEVRTFASPSSDAYELDRIFLDPSLYDRLTGGTVLDLAIMRELSDHLPVVVEVTL